MHFTSKLRNTKNSTTEPSVDERILKRDLWRACCCNMLEANESSIARAKQIKAERILECDNASNNGWNGACWITKRFVYSITNQLQQISSRKTFRSVSRLRVYSREQKKSIFEEAFPFALLIFFFEKSLRRCEWRGALGGLRKISMKFTNETLRNSWECSEVLKNLGTCEENQVTHSPHSPQLTIRRWNNRKVFVPAKKEV